MVSSKMGGRGAVIRAMLHGDSNEDSGSSIGAWRIIVFRLRNETTLDFLYPITIF
jgi:hypothetical protein